MRTPIVIILIFIASLNLHSQSISWMSFEKASFLATSGKVILVYFYSDNCIWCKRVEQDTFHDKKVISEIKKKFLPVKINPKKGGSLKVKNVTYTYEQFAITARVNSYPAYAFFYPNGRLITVAGGYKDPNNFISLLDYVSAGLKK